MNCNTFRILLSAFVILAAPRLAHAACGDGILDSGEECDDGANNSNTPDHCRTNCQLPLCGDGINDSPELCDDGMNNADNLPDHCRSDCRLPVCGDDVIDTGETCDDGNSTNGDGCDRNCTPTACGNGIVSAGEECDDGGLVDGDGCDSNCTTSRCGNGVLVVAAGETCDDGNSSNEDGCRNTCIPNTCGDGFVNRTMVGGKQVEVCDGGTDCSYDCGQDLTTCGNGVIDAGEMCDFGPAYNSSDPDALCRPDCQPRRCGDGIVDSVAGEQCDLDPGCGPLCVPL